MHLPLLGSAGVFALLATVISSAASASSYTVYPTHLMGVHWDQFLARSTPGGDWTLANVDGNDGGASFTVRVHELAAPTQINLTFAYAFRSLVSDEGQLYGLPAAEEANFNGSAQGTLRSELLLGWEYDDGPSLSVTRELQAHSPDSQGTLAFSVPVSTTGDTWFYLLPGHLQFIPTDLSALDPAQPAGALLYTEVLVTLRSVSLGRATGVPDSSTTGLLLGLGLAGLAATSRRRR